MVVTNHPPASGAFAGNAGYVEAIVSEPTNTFFGGSGTDDHDARCAGRGRNCESGELPHHQEGPGGTHNGTPPISLVLELRRSS